MRSTYEIWVWSVAWGYYFSGARRPSWLDGAIQAVKRRIEARAQALEARAKALEPRAVKVLEALANLGVRLGSEIS